MHKRFWVVAVLAVSCTPGLPSTTPLGRGPHAASTVEASGPPAPDASAVAEAAPAATTDAGASDGSEASAEAADASDGATDAGEVDAAPEAAATAKPTTVYAGHYTGRGVATFHGGPVSRPPEKDSNVQLDVVDQGSGRLEFSLLESGSGKSVCKLEATVSGKTAQLEPGQHCFDQQSHGMMTATVGSGTATFNGTQLVFDMHMDLEVHVAGRTITGSIDYHFEGTRQ